jgi:hypothetical protein
VEVRDRNDQPVGGAVVPFAIRRGSATGEGAPTLTVVFSPSLSFCSRTIQHDGTVEPEIHVNADGTVQGEGRANGTAFMASFAPAQICAITTATQTHGNGGPVTGTRDAMTFNASHPGNLGTTATYEFTGALIGDAVVGTFTFTLAGFDATERGVFAVTLQKQ